MYKYSYKTLFTFPGYLVLTSFFIFVLPLPLIRAPLSKIYHKLVSGFLSQSNNMPPAKRAAPAAAAADDSASKRSRKSTDSVDADNTATTGTGSSDTPAAPAPQIPKSTRYSAISATQNADHEYKLHIHDKTKAYEFICMYNPPFTRGEYDEDEYEEEEEEEPQPEDPSKPKPLGTKEMDGKPASEYPDHPYTITRAGRERLYYIRQNANYRNPDTFRMYTFNDHHAYGCLEVLENVILDYEEAGEDYRERWAICEGLALLFGIDGSGPITMCDNGEQVDELLRLVVRMFMNTLAQLERGGLLGSDNSEIKNLGMVMGLFMKIPVEMSDYGLLKTSRAENLGPVKDKKKWTPHRFGKQIVAYAKKYGIQLTGPYDIVELAGTTEEGDLPVLESNSSEKADVFGFAKALKKYKSQYAGVSAFMSRRAKTGGKSIGGDVLDITSWTSAERKKYAYTGKDPLSEKMLEALKEGKVIAR